MRQKTSSQKTAYCDLSLSGPTLQADASKYVNTFEAVFTPFFKNSWLPFEERAAMLDNIMVSWIKYQRQILAEQSPSFHQMCINEGYIDG